MFYSIKIKDNLKNLNEILSLQNQVRDLRLQDKIGKKNFDAGMKKVFESNTGLVKNVPKVITKQ